MKGQQDRTPSKALAVLSPVDEQLLRIGIPSAFLQAIREYQPGIGAKLVSLELDHRCPQSFLGLLCPQFLQHLIPFPHPADALCTNAEIIAVRLGGEIHAFLIRQIRGDGGFGEIQLLHRRCDGFCV